MHLGKHVQMNAPSMITGRYRRGSVGVRQFEHRLQNRASPGAMLVDLARAALHGFRFLADQLRRDAHVQRMIRILVPRIGHWVAPPPGCSPRCHPVQYRALGSRSATVRQSAPPEDGRSIAASRGRLALQLVQMAVATSVWVRFPPNSPPNGIGPRLRERQGAPGDRRMAEGRETTPLRKVLWLGLDVAFPP
jgi:hypothetical protein